VIDLTTVQWLESLSRIAASALASSIWQGLVLAAGVVLCLKCMRRTTATMRFTVWTAVFVITALMPFLHALSFGRVHSQTVAGTMPDALIKADVRWSVAIAALWLSLSLFRAIKLASGALRLRSMWKRAVPIETGTNLGSIKNLGSVNQFGSGSRAVEICSSADVDRPSVIGFFSPRILIPAWLLKKLTASELEQIVLHEMGHLRRGDDWINLFQKLGLILFPLNPVLMWIERRLCFERELACDDEVLRLTRAPKSYATCLTRLAEHRLDRRAASLSLGAWERQSEVGRRVHSILRRAEGMSRLQARVVMGALVLALLGGATGLSRCRQLVSFSEAQPPQSATALPLPIGRRFALTPVVFHPEAASRTTLLKASMSTGQEAKKSGAKTAGNIPREQHAHAPTLQHTLRPGRRMRQWVVLTSWEESYRPAMMFTVTDGRASYATVPTSNGWLVIQL
jgi:beta-lactamase regulating signal transducer with metallopeptidase domain